MFSYREGSLYTIIANSSVFINRTYRRKLGYEQIVVHTQWRGCKSRAKRFKVHYVVCIGIFNKASKTEPSGSC